MAKKIKSQLHPRSQHRDAYDLELLSKKHTPLRKFIQSTPAGTPSIDFFNAEAVRALNTSLLKHHYNLDYWDIPEGHLCPPVPGRADYIHYLADLLAINDIIPEGSKTKCLDIGTGASLIYPIIGHQTYGWSFVAADINTDALLAANKTIQRNEKLQSNITLRHQKDKTKIFRGLIKRGERFAATLCNPPFYDSPEQAAAERLRKLRNLKGKKAKIEETNFGGISHELWYEGGEAAFIHNMIWESKFFAKSVGWFTTLVSREQHLRKAYLSLKKAKVSTYKTIEMKQGQKQSRILAWNFH